MPTSTKRISSNMIKYEVKEPHLENINDGKVLKITQEVIIHNKSTIDIPNASFLFEFSHSIPGDWSSDKFKATARDSAGHIVFKQPESVVLTGLNISYPTMRALNHYMDHHQTASVPLKHNDAISITVENQIDIPDHKEYFIPTIKSVHVGTPLFDLGSTDKPRPTSKVPCYEFSTNNRTESPTAFTYDYHITNHLSPLFDEPVLFKLLDLVVHDYNKVIFKKGNIVGHKLTITSLAQKSNANAPAGKIGDPDCEIQLKIDNTGNEKTVSIFTLEIPKYEGGLEAYVFDFDFFGIPATQIMSA